LSTDANVIRADRFAEIGLIIERDVEMLVERWAQRAIKDESQAVRVHHEVLLDHLPGFLAEMARGLMQAGEAYDSPHCLPAVAHGEQRWQSGWSLNELVQDFQILRLVVLNHLDEVLPRPLRLKEIMAVGLALDEAIGASVVGYSQYCEEQSRQQAEALQEADRRKNEFLAVVAHELRNPLAPLRNSLDVIRVKGFDGVTVGQLADIMDRQVAQLTRLVEDLLDVSRIALGKLTLRQERLDLRNALTQSIQATTHLAKLRHHQLDVSRPDEPLWVDGDSSRLVQVFVNLVNNAVKYTPDGGKISVAAEKTADTAVVGIRDNGIGIPPEMLSRIFGLFTQIDLNSDREPGGLGIGLALVRRLVEMHGGVITAQSEGPQRGSAFTVTIPLARVESIQNPAKGSAMGAAPSRHVLLIEDNADGRDSLAMLLRLVGHQVVAAADGARGIAAALEHKPDVALVDIGLPDIDGYEVARRLRASIGPNLFLVALTGFSQREDRERALAAGFDAHLAKPVDLSTLQALLAARSGSLSQSPATGP